MEASHSGEREKKREKKMGGAGLSDKKGERREYIKQTPSKYVFRPNSFIRNASRGQTTA